MIRNSAAFLIFNIIKVISVAPQKNFKNKNAIQWVRLFTVSQHALYRGMSAQRGIVCPQGGVCPRGVYARGVSAQEGCLPSGLFAQGGGVCPGRGVSAQGGVSVQGRVCLSEGRLPRGVWQTHPGTRGRHPPPWTE